MARRDEYISFEEAETQLGVTRATLHYYMKRLDIKKETFPLDRKAYMKRSDFARIKNAKDEASGGEKTLPDVA